MTRNTALDLMVTYCSQFQDLPSKGKSGAVKDASSLPERWPENGSLAKAMRWLGYTQGICVAEGIYTVEEVKEHSRRGYV